MTNQSALAAQRWYWQHLSGAVLAVCVFVHIGVILYAMRGGLTGAEILARTRGNWAFGTLYTVFVLACAVHVFTGVKNVLEEWFGFSRAGAQRAAQAFSWLILVLGLVAVYAVTAS